MPFDLETPAFVIDGEALIARATCLAREFDRCRFSYSVKTLAVPEAVLIAKEAGWLIEVVSGDEYDFVRRIGVTAEEIIVNGPSKDDRLLRAALAGGARVHVDSEEELCRAVAIRATAASGRLGVRLGLGVTDPRWARFGIDSAEIDTAIRDLAKACNGRMPNGFHVHSGTNRASLQEFLLIAARAVGFAQTFSRYTRANIEWIDLGGGFPDPFVSPSGATTWNPPNIEQFVREATSLTNDWDAPCPLLIFEPGRALVGQCVDLFTRVETAKSVAGIQVATLDAGLNSLPFARSFTYPVEMCDATDELPMETVLCGPLCMADDVIRYDAMLPPLRKGDILRIRGVGAYNISMSFDFIRRRASIYFLKHGQIFRTQSMFS